LIQDAAGQDHSVLPYNANRLSASSQCGQKITGVKQHGHSNAIYRSLPHIKADTNLQCQCLALEIERRQLEVLGDTTGKKCFPRQLRLRADGGPDMTSDAFMAFLNYLVAVGIFDTVSFNRLPVGHTHEDIDAMFGTIWTNLRNETIITFQQWEELAKNSFNDSKMYS
jgi:hypothetical protein